MSSNDENQQKLQLSRKREQLENELLQTGRSFSSEELNSQLFDTSYVDLGDNVKHILLKTDSPEQILIVSEPLSLSWIALQIASGVLAAVGAKVLKSALGPDFVRLNENSIKEVARHLEHVVAADALRRAVGQLDSNQRLLREYYNNQDRVHLLETLREKSSDLISELKTLGLPALQSFMVTGSLRLAVLQLIWGKTKKDGDKVTMTQAAAEYENIAGSIWGEYRKAVLGRFTGLVGANGDHWWYWYQDKQIEINGDLEHAQRVLISHKKRVTAAEKKAVAGEEFDATTLKWWGISSFPRRP